MEILSILNYNWQLMSTENYSENTLETNINAIFRGTPDWDSPKGRIRLGADAISDRVNLLDSLSQEQEVQFGSVGSASRFDTALGKLGLNPVFGRIGPSAIIMRNAQFNTVEELQGLLTSEDVDESPEVEKIFFDDELSDDTELFTDIEKADLALKASIDGIIAQYRLTPLQARKAIRLSRKDPL